MTYLLDLLRDIRTAILAGLDEFEWRRHLRSGRNPDDFPVEF